MQQRIKIGLMIFSLLMGASVLKAAEGESPAMGILGDDLARKYYPNFFRTTPVEPDHKLNEMRALVSERVPTLTDEEKTRLKEFYETWKNIGPIGGSEAGPPSGAGRSDGPSGECNDRCLCTDIIGILANDCGTNTDCVEHLASEWSAGVPNCTGDCYDACYAAAEEVILCTDTIMAHEISTMTGEHFYDYDVGALALRYIAYVLAEGYYPNLKSYVDMKN